MKNLLVLIVLLLLASLMQAQCSASAKAQQQITSTSKKALKYFEKARSLADARMYIECIAELKKAVAEDPSFVEAYVMMGDIYFYLKDPSQSEWAYENAVRVNPGYQPVALYYLAQYKIVKGDYESAHRHFKQYLKYPNTNTVYINNAIDGVRTCDFALNAIANPVPFNPVNLGPHINTEFDEYYPTITVDNSMLLFTRSIEDQTHMMGLNEDFFVSYQINGEWTPSVNLGGPINTVLNEGAPTLSADGQILIFTACELYGQYGPGRDGYGRCDLFFTKKIDDRWLSPQNMGVPINTANWESQPSFASDGQTLYFVRGVFNDQRNKSQDIWVTRLGEDGFWGQPERLGHNINTSGTEESVLIHPDGQTLYFSSDGHTGMGGLDIFMSKLDTNGQWGPPVNLGYPINTHKNENSLMVSGDGKLAYFASDREGGFGKLDLYSFELPEQAKPELVSYMKGRVFDKETTQPLAARFELIDLETGRMLISSTSNKGNGEYLVSLPVNKDYALNVSKNGYLFYSENFALKELATKLDPVIRNIPLQPVKANEIVVLNNIFFETGKYELKVESKIELNKLIALLQKNPAMTIEIRGHTDNIGGDTDNLQLSHNRAHAVYAYLIEQGIIPERLAYKGYGETIPVASNDTAEGRAKNRRTEFKVLRVE